MLVILPDGRTATVHSHRGTLSAHDRSGLGSVEILEATTREGLRRSLGCAAARYTAYSDFIENAEGGLTVQARVLCNEETCAEGAVRAALHDPVEASEAEAAQDWAVEAVTAAVLRDLPPNPQTTDLHAWAWAMGLTGAGGQPYPVPDLSRALGRLNQDPGPPTATPESYPG
ncbi:hypothetical protein [Streptomyces sp. Isolate_45]|uniref:hypothetical protein n=1 Tax=Streptomyces sp. Isolate_45 TaxID=2950111 RepID=UPI002481B883|nr:hypothetical protein [Streptomyces sp. Isolate_45]MDA5279912.1 hypothetical protein [Streptomyces sp. Isolate_45]